MMNSGIQNQQMNTYFNQYCQSLQKENVNINSQYFTHIQEIKVKEECKKTENSRLSNNLGSLFSLK